MKETFEFWKLAVEQCWDHMEEAKSRAIGVKRIHLLVVRRLPVALLIGKEACDISLPEDKKRRRKALESGHGGTIFRRPPLNSFIDTIQKNN
jgi:hypothetical protein